MSLNKVMLIGQLCDEPRFQELIDGRPSVGLSVVTRMSHWFDFATGEERHGDEWHRVVVFAPKLIERVRTGFSPDDEIYVEGRLQTKHWQDDTFEWRSLTRIVLSRDSDELRRLGAEDAMLGRFPSLEEAGRRAGGQETDHV